MSELLMSTKDISKQYDRSGFKLGPINLNLYRGEAVAILGRNGSGKSTLFQIMTGNLDASSGEVVFLGKKFRPERYELKRIMGYLPQHAALPSWVTGKEILDYAIRLHSLPNPTEILRSTMHYWDCEFYARKPLAACSHGMQKRVALALATIHNPDFLILDEPFSGLDLYHIKALIDMVEKRKLQSKTTIICTHIAPYAARLCERVQILHDGIIDDISDWTQISYEQRIDRLESIFFETIGT